MVLCRKTGRQINIRMHPEIPEPFEQGVKLIKLKFPMPYFLLFCGRYLPLFVRREQVAKYERENSTHETTHW